MESEIKVKIKSILDRQQKHLMKDSINIYTLTQAQATKNTYFISDKGKRSGEF